MSEKIKSAFEKAMERLATFEEAPPEEVERLDQMPRGRAIGAAFMENRNFNLFDALMETPQQTRQYVIEGVEEILLVNIALPPAGDDPDSGNKRAMEGLLIIKKERDKINKVLGELDYLLKYYRQSLDQAMESFKREYEARSRTRAQAGRGNDSVRNMREDWAAMVQQINSRFEGSLTEIKQKIRSTR